TVCNWRFRGVHLRQNQDSSVADLSDDVTGLASVPVDSVSRESVSCGSSPPPPTISVKSATDESWF
ncbi:hypothetical protein, partial [Bacteroides heparinolyticus]|uniref:hypothetical protein n=1 Tax=Prevotella heparinolytica TaxID=28113 RepID=UPI0035A112EA